MENSESLYKAGDILRDICSEEFQLGEDGSVTQTGHRDVGKLHHSLNLFFYYCLHFNNLKAASKMWNHPVIANTELKSGPKVPTTIRNNNRHNRLIYYIMLYRCGHWHLVNLGCGGEISATNELTYLTCN